MNFPLMQVDGIVVDASFLTALCAQEPGRYAIASSEIAAYAQRGALFYAPNVIISEVQFALCRKLSNGSLTQAEHLQAMHSFQTWMTVILPPSMGEASLLVRAEQLRHGYGCSRAADSLYLALAEELGRVQTVRVITFDQDLLKQAARNAPSVSVQLL